MIDIVIVFTIEIAIVTTGDLRILIFIKRLLTLIRVLGSMADFCDLSHEYSEYAESLDFPVDSFFVLLSPSLETCSSSP